VGIQSISLALAALLSFWYGLNHFNGEDALTAARTYCFITLAVGELLRAYSARSEEKMIYKMKIFSNMFLNISVLGSLLLLMAVVYIPFLQPIFHTVSLSLFELDMALLFAMIPLIGGEIAKKLK
ncbi:MAG: calcium-translocating P-type ATPase, SERCA-type, partial [Defluviitaleaceae bacterium]|nr:calcium-translocating P-type ATPase, SERCA-type [Defluviitaleaceae bacterium]